MALSLLSEAVDLPGVYAQFPWLEPLIIAPERLHVLLGPEGNGGQGLQALSAMLGHSHPTTTMRHYVHLMCIALYASLRAQNTLNMQRSFEQRVASRASVQRWAKSAREHTLSSDGESDETHRVNRCMRDTIIASIGEGVHVDPTPLEIDMTTPLDAPTADPVSPTHTTQIDFDQFEAVDRALRDGVDTADVVVIDAARLGLHKLAQVPSGKRGSSARRHPLEKISDECYLPARIAAGTATTAADQLCHWLEAMRVQSPECLAWLMDKWIHASEAERGRMRLDGDQELKMAGQLPASRWVALEIQQAAVSKKRKHKNSKSAHRMRIRCLNAKGTIVTRDTGAVRWVMSYSAGLFLSGSF